MRGAQRRQQRLRYGDLPEHVDVELLAQVVGVQHLEWPAVADAGVVDERVEPAGRGVAISAKLADAPGHLAICAKSVTSSVTGSIRPAGALATSRSPASSLRTPASTVHPAPASRSAVASPMPVEAPVISTLGIVESYLTAVVSHDLGSAWMVPRVIVRKNVRKNGSRRKGARIVLALAAPSTIAAALALTGCGAGLPHGGEEASADVDTATPGSCGASVLGALGHVATRVYGEGIDSERTASAAHMIEGSSALRSAVEAGDAGSARAAARALIATGHLTNLRVVRGGKVLIELGGPALAPLRGTLLGADSRPIADYVTSVWAAGGIVAETNGIAEATTVIRSARTPQDARTVAGSFPLPAGPLPTQGTLTKDGVAYQFTSYAAKAYPEGAPLRVYLLRTIESVQSLCGTSDEDTVVNTISRIAHLIYDGEAGRRTVKQVRRVQENAALLHAVARRDPKGTRSAIEALLHQHIVRLRVSAGGRLLADVGGPYVLAPVTAPLRLQAVARSAASRSRSRTTRATSAWPTGWPAWTC